MAEKKKKSEIIIVLFCLLGMAICLYLLKTPTFLTPKDHSTEVALGTVNEINDDVRLKVSNQYFWQATEQNQILTEGDSLFTGPKSSSEITLSDGKKIRISENSLIRLTTRNQQLSVDLAFGKLFSTGSSQPMVISDCGKLYTIEPNDATFELSKGKNCGSIDVTVSKGTVKLNKKSIVKMKIKPLMAKSVFTAPAEEVQTVTESTTITSPATPAETAPTIARLDAPQFDKKLYEMTLAKSSRVDLTWKSVPQAKEYLLEFSETESFEKPEVVHVSETNYSYNPNADGVHFFRIKAISDTGSASEFGDAAKAILTYPKIQLGQKKLKAEYKARTSKDLGSKKSFPITWTSVPHAAKYVVDVDSSSDFKKPISIVSRKPASSIHVPQTGTYHYRVSAFNQLGRRISSSESPGEINYEKMFDMATPAIEPSLKSLSFYFQKKFGQFIWLRWLKLSSSSDLKYRIQLAASTDFEKLFYDQVTSENKVLLNKNLPQGEYFWRVRSENSEQQSSDWSDLGSFKIQTQIEKTTNAK